MRVLWWALVLFLRSRVRNSQGAQSISIQTNSYLHPAERACTCSHARMGGRVRTRACCRVAEYIAKVCANLLKCMGYLYGF